MTGRLLYRLPYVGLDADGENQNSVDQLPVHNKSDVILLL